MSWLNYGGGPPVPMCNHDSGCREQGPQIYGSAKSRWSELQKAGWRYVGGMHICPKHGENNQRPAKIGKAAPGQRRSLPDVMPRDFDLKGYRRK